MSDIVIPNAKLPINCFTCAYEKLTENCPCHIGICSASEYKNSRHPDCPLVEVPPHGRLIDADFFKKYAIRVSTEDGREYIPSNYVDIVPAILEASK